MMTVNALIERMSPKTEFSSFFDDGRKGEMLKGLFSSYYYRVPAGHVIFDTNRGWTSRATILKALFPAARIICCVRDVAWILDSIETMLSRNPFEISRILGF
jgi:sulfotransferase